jgi:hypothetical protein
MVVADASASLRLLSRLFLLSVLFDACLNNLGEPVFDDVSVVILMTWYVSSLLQCLIIFFCGCCNNPLSFHSAFTLSPVQSPSCDAFYYPRNILLHGHAHRLDFPRSIRSTFRPFPVFLHCITSAPRHHRCTPRWL